MLLDILKLKILFFQQLFLLRSIIHLFLQQVMTSLYFYFLGLIILIRVMVLANIYKDFVLPEFELVAET